MCEDIRFFKAYNFVYEAGNLFRDIEKSILPVIVISIKARNPEIPRFVPYDGTSENTSITVVGIALN